MWPSYLRRVPLLTFLSAATGIHLCRPRRLPSHSPRPRLTSRHLSYDLRSRPHWPGLDEQILQAFVDDCTRPVGRRMMTADLRILHPCDTEHAQAVRRQTRAMRELNAKAFPESEAGEDEPRPAQRHAIVLRRGQRRKDHDISLVAGFFGVWPPTGDDAQFGPVGTAVDLLIRKRLLVVELYSVDREDGCAPV